jgi:hypothetical protein
VTRSIKYPYIYIHRIKGTGILHRPLLCVVFENRVLRRIFGPRRDGVTGGWRKLHNEEPHNLYSSPSIIRMINIVSVVLIRSLNSGLPLCRTLLSGCRSRDSVAGIATGYGLDDREVGVRVPVGSRIIFSPRRPDRFWGPPSLLSIGYRGGGAHSPGAKHRVREADHSPPASAEVKKMWIYTSTPPYAFMA